MMFCAWRLPAEAVRPLAVVDTALPSAVTPCGLATSNGRTKRYEGTHHRASVLCFNGGRRLSGIQYPGGIWGGDRSDACQQ